MARDSHATEPNAAELADLSALADGTLEPARRDEVRARIAGSEQLNQLYERERRVVESLHELRARDRAPASLRRKLQASRPAPKDRRWLRTRWHVNMPGLVAGMASAAVIVLAVVLLAPSGTPGAPSISQAAALATRGSTAPAPQPDPSAPGVKLNVDVQDLYFPNWSTRGYRAVGQRTDRIDGRFASTVYYNWHGHNVAYTIVSAPALKQPAASVTTINGTVLRTLQLDGRYIVTWRRSNHTCVLSVAGAPPAQLAAELQQLAASES